MIAEVPAPVALSSVEACSATVKSGAPLAAAIAALPSIAAERFRTFQTSAITSAGTTSSSAPVGVSTAVRNNRESSVGAGLVQTLAELLRQCAAYGVDRAAGGERHDVDDALGARPFDGFGPGGDRAEQGQQ